jgi:anti-repressor protein
MDELIKIEEVEGKETVNARELHTFLEVGRDFANWIKQRIEKYGFIEGIDFTPELAKSVGGRPERVYHISIDMAKELSMVENNEKGKEARQYFIARERQAKELEKRFQVPTSFAEALRLAADQQDQIVDLKQDKRQLQVKAIRDQPKVEFYDTVVDSDGALSWNDTAKLLGIKGLGRNKLIQYFRDKKVLDGSSVPYQRFVDAGYFNVVETSWTSDYGTTHISKTARIYQRGLDWIRKVLKKDGYFKKENN